MIFPGFPELVCLTLGHEVIEGDLFVPRRYPEEFRRKVLDLVAAGRPVAQAAADPGISDQTIYVRRKQELIAAKRRIRELEHEVTILKRARELLKE